MIAPLIPLTAIELALYAFLGLLGWQLLVLVARRFREPPRIRRPRYEITNIRWRRR